LDIQKDKHAGSRRLDPTYAESHAIRMRKGLAQVRIVLATGARRGCLRVTSREYTFMYFL
jgi:hypothetical protein